MREEAFSTAERSFVTKALEAKLRVDGRPLHEARKTEVYLRKADGCAEVTVGATRAVASVFVEAVQPYADRPSEGMISFSVEFSPAASERFAFEIGAMGMSGSTSEETVALTRAVERSIRDSRALDTESLCILAGKLVWSLRVDVQVVDFCGNALDAAELVAITALKHAHRPEVTVSGTEVTIHPVTHREPVPLPVHHIPIATTFALLEDGASALIDPSLQEEMAMQGKLTIIVNAHGEICGFHKAGGASIEPDVMMKCTKLATKRALEVTELLGKAFYDATVRVPAAGAMEEVPVVQEPMISLGNMKIVSPTNAEGKPMQQQQPPPPREDAVMNEVNPPPPPPLTSLQSSNTSTTTTVTQMDVKTASQTADKKPTPKHKHADSDEDDEDEDDDDDDDLMNAVISRPRGGGGRKSKPRLKTSTRQ